MPGLQYQHIGHDPGHGEGRPDVEAVFVIRDGRSHIVTIAAIHAVYHFEDHPVTADRRR